MVSKKDSKDSAIKQYSHKIESFLMRNKGKLYSEFQLAENIFGLKLRKRGNIPKSEKELRQISYIRDALKVLMAEKRVSGSLLEDPNTKEEVMHYQMKEGERNMFTP